MKNFLSEQWALERRFLQDGFSRTITTCAVAFAILTIIGFVACLIFQSVMNMFVTYLSTFISTSGIIDESGNVSAPLLFANNLKASIFSIVFGVFPFVYLPAFPLGLNSTLIGAMAAYYVVNRLSLAAFFAGIIPHGIFEIPALIVSFALGIYLCSEVSSAVREKNRENVKPIGPIFANLARTYVFFVAPLLLVAAIVEAYVTPLVISLFM
ncbi:MAG: stage II sporulation protein M [Oscillospiraceae bacterium]|nr:stage II sporulation protein M [Oscillospiraceae bacterium]